MTVQSTEFQCNFAPRAAERGLGGGPHPRDMHPGAGAAPQCPASAVSRGTYPRVSSSAFDPYGGSERRGIARQFSLKAASDWASYGRCRTRRRAVMATGNVKWFNPTKGYGFIQPSDGGKDVFVHISAVERAGLSTLNEGQQVEYELVSNRGKSSAENLKVK